MTIENLKASIDAMIKTNGNQEISGSVLNRILKEVAVTPLRQLYAACGAVFNDITGFYELNGLTDITEEQMAQIYVATKDYPAPASHCDGETGIRTNIIRRKNVGLLYDIEQRMDNYFRYCSELEVVWASPSWEIPLGLRALRTTTMFSNCVKLRSVFGYIDMSSCVQSGLMFWNCPALQDVWLQHIGQDVHLAESPLISKDSIIYMMYNCQPAAKIIITLHPDAYDRLISDPDIMLGLGDNKNITLVSA